MKKTEEKALDKIINEMVEAVENSKEDICRITDDSLQEYKQLQEQLEQIKEEVVEVIEESDQLEKKAKLSRQRLAEVSSNFNKYEEDEIKEVYEQTHQLQSELKLKQTREMTLRQKRDEIERHLLKVDQTIERANGLVSKVSVVLNYLTEDFKQVGELIQDANEKQAFGLKIIEAQEEERRRLSREMHDGPAQMLANILLRSDLVDRTFRERGRNEAMKEMKSVRSMVRSSLYEVRRIIYDLRPMALDDLGLIPTIKKYLANMEEYNEISIYFKSIDKEERLPGKYEVALFRLIQEAVQNAIKHAQTDQINVKLEINAGHIAAKITDNGKGFDTSEKKDNSFGLIGMRERIEMLSGELQVQSKIGEGTTILIRIPLND
ncbi:signal transduction histidine-protein kinase/phosphatase DegS [Paraliobacillus quinghaiensis]|uniref:Signal transduction histidine-protein kinase/phosphatase DegS n=1 Tax=Paraliobacillus quinghaiensis TaxID=470815 RepID=A0A917TSJ2_9BACI|nr:sensor histidine kinase [Paraliobacillus quinghaiensis]GGM35524.1 signal transduction histidine-protein kinase/phosphatase DegS [Paraliobacillus quinghaiensis]